MDENEVLFGFKSFMDDDFGIIPEIVGDVNYQLDQWLVGKWLSPRDIAMNVIRNASNMGNGFQVESIVTIGLPAATKIRWKHAEARCWSYDGKRTRWQPPVNDDGFSAVNDSTVYEFGGGLMAPVGEIKREREGRGGSVFTRKKKKFWFFF
ncbi:unnamed protein product [Citrullus colocynthis]|uniref:Uncharacterized protein n=1 Tax=Citrullus colocynthis TaxID=252529 RepID=A0ABP0YIV0_9ROSI